MQKYLENYWILILTCKVTYEHQQWFESNCTVLLDDSVNIMPSGEYFAINVYVHWQKSFSVFFFRWEKPVFKAMLVATEMVLEFVGTRVNLFIGFRDHYIL